MSGLKQLLAELQTSFQNYPEEVALAKQSLKEEPIEFFNENNTPAQWIGKVGDEFKNRGFAEGLHGLSNPLIMNNLVYPYAEPAISNIRVANYKAGKPFDALNYMLGQ